MNSQALLELARERSHDLVDAGARNRNHLLSKEELPASEEVFLFGRSSHVIDARVRAQARLRVTTSALELS